MGVCTELGLWKQNSEFQDDHDSHDPVPVGAYCWCQCRARFLLLYRILSIWSLFSSQLCILSLTSFLLSHAPGSVILRMQKCSRSRGSLCFTFSSSCSRRCCSR